jgi:hypothetical protein
MPSREVTEYAHNERRTVLGQNFLYSEERDRRIGLFNVFYGARYSD